MSHMLGTKHTNLHKSVAFIALGGKVIKKRFNMCDSSQTMVAVHASKETALIC